MSEMTLIDILTGVGQLCEYQTSVGVWEPVYIMAFIGAAKPEDEYVELTYLIGGGKWKVSAPHWPHLLRKATMSRAEYLAKHKEETNGKSSD